MKIKMSIICFTPCNDVLFVFGHPIIFEIITSNVNYYSVIQYFTTIKIISACCSYIILSCIIQQHCHHNYIEVNGTKTKLRTSEQYQICIV